MSGSGLECVQDILASGSSQLVLTPEERKRAQCYGTRHTTTPIPTAAIGALGNWGPEIWGSLFQLYAEGYEPLAPMLAVGSSPRSDVDVRNRIEKMVISRYERANRALNADDLLKLKRFVEQITYAQADASSAAAWTGENGLAAMMADRLYRPESAVLRVIHSLAPDLMEGSLQGMKAAGMVEGQNRFGFIKLLGFLEKPFGLDRESADRLSVLAHEVYGENVFLADHYLTKFMFKCLVNMILEDPLLNLSYEHVEALVFTLDESAVCDGRTDTYDAMGAVKDMLCHALFTLSKVLMPRDILARAIVADEDNGYKAMYRDAQLKVLEGLQFDAELAWFGQYGDGTIGSERIVGYRRLTKHKDGVEVPVTPHTPTFFALKFTVTEGPLAPPPEEKNPRPVHIYVRHGKGLRKKVTMLEIVYRPTFTTIDPSRRRYKRFVFHGHDGRQAMIEDGFIVRGPGMDRNLRHVQSSVDLLEKLGGSSPFPYSLLLQGKWWNHPSRRMWRGFWSLAERIVALYEKDPDRVMRYEPGGCGPDTPGILRLGELAGIERTQ